MELFSFKVIAYLDNGKRLEHNVFSKNVYEVKKGIMPLLLIQADGKEITTVIVTRDHSFDDF